MLNTPQVAEKAMTRVDEEPHNRSVGDRLFSCFPTTSGVRYADTRTDIILLHKHKFANNQPEDTRLITMVRSLLSITQSLPCWNDWPCVGVEDASDKDHVVSTECNRTNTAFARVILVRQNWLAPISHDRMPVPNTAALNYKKTVKKTAHHTNGYILALYTLHCVAGFGNWTYW